MISTGSFENLKKRSYRRKVKRNEHVFQNKEKVKKIVKVKTLTVNILCTRFETNNLRNRHDSIER